MSASLRVWSCFQLAWLTSLAGWPKEPSIEPVAAAQRMGVPNMIFARYGGKPATAGYSRAGFKA